jgi:hypothetical protein
MEARLVLTDALISETLRRQKRGGKETTETPQIRSRSARNETQGRLNDGDDQRQ